MLALLPQNEQPGLLFKAHFLHRLLADMRDRVAMEIETMEPRAMATLADRLYFARNADQPVMATTSTIPDEAVSAIKQPQRGGKGHPKKKKKGSGSQPADSVGRKLCRTHKKYGAAAYGCLDAATCQWQGNE